MSVIWYMSRLTILKIPLRSLTMITWDYLSLPLIDNLRVRWPKSKIFHHPKTSQSNSYFFPWLGQLEPLWAKSFKIIQIWLKPFPFTRTSLHWDNLNPFRPKRPRQIQTWLKSCPLIQKKFCPDSSHCCNIPSQHPLQSRFLT